MEKMNDSFDWISELLDKQDQQLLADRIEADVRAQREAKIIGAVRSTVRQRRNALREAVPVHVERSIRMAIAAEAHVQLRPSLFGRLRSVLAAVLSRPSYAIAGIAGIVIAVASLVVFTQGPAALPSNLSDAALTAYTDVASSDGDVGLRSADKNDLRAYFANCGVDFEVFFPTVAAELVGGSVRTINGEDFPVLVYRTAGHFISLLEVDQKSINSSTVRMDKAAADDVEKSKWHWASSDDRTLFVWESNSIMCSVVSDLAVNEVSALFSLEVL
ncbi:MAG: hypothetical protein RIR53_512 [Bacteroidota bacterium]|jgi:hypothetical protein